MKKNIALILAAALVLPTVIAAGGCGANSGVSNSAEATAENPMVLTLAHGLSETHTVHNAMTQFADEVKEKTDLPYIFNDTEDFYDIMDSEDMQDFFLSSEEDGFVTITYFTSGARSFYTKDKAIRVPEDLKGLKIRVQDMKSQTDMLTALGGTPVAMSYGDVYTALSTGIIDGTENNETALTTGKHGEVCKVYSVDQHAMIPDVMVMSAKVWNNIAPEDQEIILQCAHDATEWHKEAWDQAVDEAITEAEDMGVEFVYDVDKEAFREATAGMIDEYREEYPGVADLLDRIDGIREEEE